MPAGDVDADREVGRILAMLLRTWRERALLTQEQLAARTGLGVRTIRRLETAALQRPRGDSLRLLADALELTESERQALVTAARGATDAAAPSGTPIGNQLPADVPGFAGRTEQLRRLDALLAGPGLTRTAVISALSGTAGVGKTALAVHWAHLVAGQFPDGQLYVNLRGYDPGGTPMSPAEAVRGFLDALRVPAARLPVTVAAQAALYRSLLADRRVLIVLDNARDAEQVRPLLPGTPGCFALVTSRSQLTSLVASEGAYPLTLDLLSTVESHELLVGRLGAERVAAEPDDVRAIVASCARLPLALAIAAARAATYPRFPLSAIAGELRAARGGLDGFDASDPATDLRTVFSWSYGRLTAEASRLFRLVGSHAGPDISAAAAASLAGLPGARVTRLLAELTGAHLITEHTPGRFTLHDLLRAYGRELADLTDPADERLAARHRILDHYTHTARTAVLSLEPWRTPVDLSPPMPGVRPEQPADIDGALAWLDTERRVLFANLEMANASAEYRRTWQLAWALSNFYPRRGHILDWAASQQIALLAARQLDDLVMQAKSHISIGGAYNALGRHGEAAEAVHAAFLLYERLDDRMGQVRCLANLAKVYEHQGRHEESLACALRALDLVRAEDDKHGEARVLNAIGWELAQLGDHDAGLAHCQEALTLHRKFGYDNDIANTLDSLGFIHHCRGEHAQAVGYFREALDIWLANGDVLNQADVYEHLGTTYAASGHPETARENWGLALDLLSQLHHPNAERVRSRLAELDDDTHAGS